MKHALRLSLFFVAALPFALAAADSDEIARELKTDGVKVNSYTAADNPKSVTSADELKKLIEDAASREKIAKQVDFEKQVLLVFSWRGSGQDAIAVGTVKEGKKPEITIDYTRGRTKDLRTHLHLFAVPKEATWKVAKK